jgi:hypothetical protein
MLQVGATGIDRSFLEKEETLNFPVLKNKYELTSICFQPSELDVLFNFVKKYFSDFLIGTIRSYTSCKSDDLSISETV